LMLPAGQRLVAATSRRRAGFFQCAIARLRAMSALAPKADI
jgi:hypothetical protein